MKYLKSRTIWLSILLAAMSAANAYFEANLTPVEYSGVGVLFASAIAYLRTQTDKALSEV